jgi:arylsulfatase A
LYNLEDDLGEKHNLAERMPEKAAELRNMLHAWRKQMNAKMPASGPRDDLQVWEDSRSEE